MKLLYWSAVIAVIDTICYGVAVHKQGKPLYNRWPLGGFYELFKALKH